MQLSTQAREILNAHFIATAQAYGVPVRDPAVGQHYAATPSVAQTLYDKIIEQGDWFLQQINGAVPVSEIVGEKIGLSLNGRTAGRTDTSGTGERTPKRLDNTSAKGYTLSITEFDIALAYAKIDSWAKFPDFAARYMGMVRRAIGNDMLQTGWTGTSIAAATDIVTNPLLQDLNKGWLQLIREFNSGSQYLLGGTKGLAGAVTLGESNEAIGGFVNLDVLAQAAKEMLPVYHQDRPDLVMIVGNDVLTYQKNAYLKANGNTPSEKKEFNQRMFASFAEMPTFYAPFFPNSSLLVTPLDNLSIYYQDTSVRRLQKDKPEKNEVQEFNSVNLGYVVEDEEQTAFVENITFA